MEFPPMISSGRYECVVCRVHAVTLADLHRHQTYRHTSEELSLSSIVFRSTFLNRNETNPETHYLQSWLRNPQYLSHLYTCSSRLLNDGNNNSNHIVPLNYVMGKDNFHEEETPCSKNEFFRAHHEQKIEKIFKRRDCEVLDLSRNISYLRLENPAGLDSQDVQHRAEDNFQINDNAVEENELQIARKKRNKRIFNELQKGTNSERIRGNLESAWDNEEEMDVKAVKIGEEIEEKGAREKKIPRTAVKYGKKRLKMSGVDDEEEILVDFENCHSESEEDPEKRKKMTRSQTLRFKDTKALKNPVKMLEIALDNEDHRCEIIGANEEVNFFIPETELMLSGCKLSQRGIIENSEKRVATLNIASDNEENRGEIASDMKIDYLRSTKDMSAKHGKSTKSKLSTSKPSKVPKKPGNMIEIALNNEDHRDETMEENEGMNVLIPETELTLPTSLKPGIEKMFFQPKPREFITTEEMLNISSDIEDRGEKIVDDDEEIKFLTPGAEITIPARRRPASKKKLFQLKGLRAPGKTVETVNNASNEENNQQEISQDIEIHDLEIVEVPAKCTRSSRSNATILKPTKVSKKSAKTLKVSLDNQDHREEIIRSNNELELFTRKIITGSKKPKPAIKKRLRQRRIVNIRTKSSKIAPVKHKKSTKSSVTCRKPKKITKKPAKRRMIELSSENELEEMPENEKTEETKVPDGINVDRETDLISENSQDDAESMESRIVTFQEAKTFPLYPQNMDERTILVFDPVARQLVWTSFELTDESTYDNDNDDYDSHSEQELTIVEYDTPQVQDYIESDNSLPYGFLPFRLDRKNMPNDEKYEPNHREDMPNGQEDMPNGQEDIPTILNAIEEDDRENMPDDEDAMSIDRENMPDDQDDMSTDGEDMPNYREDTPDDEEGLSDYQEDTSTDREEMPKYQKNDRNDQKDSPNDRDVLNYQEDTPEHREDMAIDPENTSIESEYTPSLPANTSNYREYTLDETSASSQSQGHETTQENEKNSRKIIFTPRPRRTKLTPKRYVPY